MGQASKSRCLIIRELFFITLLLGSFAGHLDGQAGPFLSPYQAPQAKTEKEFDAYLNILTSQDPKQTITRVNLFTKEFPNSQLLGLAFEHEMRAYAKLNDWREVLQSGERALQLEPENVKTLLSLAAGITNGIASDTLPITLLNKAKQLSKDAVYQLGQMRIPRQVPLNKWRVMLNKMEAQAHEIRGQIDVLQENSQGARSEFAAAIRVSPQPHGLQYLRLGLADESLGKTNQAHQAFEHAVQLGPSKVRQLAKKELTGFTHSTARENEN